MLLTDHALYEYTFGVTSPSVTGWILDAARTFPFGMTGTGDIHDGRLAGGAPPAHYEARVGPGNPAAVAVRLLPHSDQAGWLSLARTWDDALGPPPSGAMLTGCARVYVAGYTASPDHPGAAWRALAETTLAVPPGVGETGIAEPLPGVLLWEVAPAPAAPLHRRHIVLLAPVDLIDLVDRWLWSVDGALPGCLWAAAQIRAQSRRWEKLRPDTSRRAVRASAAEVLGLLTSATATDRLRRRSIRLALVHAEVRDIATTVASARADAERILESWPGLGTDRGLIAADLRTARRLEREAADETARAHAVLDMIEPLDRLIAGRTERYLRARTDRTEQLVLLQTALLSALVVVLTAIQSLGYTWPLAPSLRLPVIVTLGSAAVVFPLYAGRLPTAAAPRRRTPAWLSIPLAGLAAALAWLTVTVCWRLIAATTAPPEWTLPLVTAASSAVLGAAWWRRGRSGDRG